MGRCVVSLDYDGCGDILSTELAEQYYSDNEFMAVRIFFNNYLVEVIDGRRVDLYVGSNRQSYELNEHNKTQNRNGCCFANYQRLCEQRKWTFQQLLLADTENNLASGTAMEDKKHQSSFDQLKINIIVGQLSDIKKNHPDEKIDFYFFDDDARDIIIPALTTYFIENPDKVPVNVTMHLVKFDWHQATCDAKNPIAHKATLNSQGPATVSLISQIN